MYEQTVSMLTNASQGKGEGARNSWTARTVLLGSLAVIGTGLIVYRSWKKKQTAKKKLEDAIKQFPENDAKIKPRAPGAGAPLCTGLRIVEMSTVIAGPCCARMFGDLGAEVIKIEEPKGDYWRNFFLPYEPGRVFASAFEAVNFSKKSVVLDVKKAEDLKKLKAILKDADVFITNVRVDALRRLGLAYDQIHQEFPHLIYGVVTAWGDRGPDYKKPGYDLGAYWASTGMAAMIQKPGWLPSYTVGMGDILMASFLFSSINLALLERLKTGRGRFFTSSLFHLGIWNLLPQFVKPIDRPGVPNYTHAPPNPFYTNYKTKDNKIFNLLGFGQEEHCQKALGLGPEHSEKAHEILKEKFISMTLDEVSTFLKERKLEFSPTCGFLDFVKADPIKSPWRESNVFTSLSGSSIQTVRIPFDINCSDDHDIKSRAPRIGQSTTSFLETGWSAIDPRAEIKKAAPGLSLEGSNSNKHLEGITVVVFPSSTRVSALMVAKLLCERGATIVTISRNNSVIETRFQELYAVLTKAHKIVSDSNVGISSLISQAQVFITDENPECLQATGIDFETLHRLHPKLVYAQASLFGSQCSLDNSIHGDLGPFWGSSALGENLSGKPPAPHPPMPIFLGDLSNSVHLFAAVCGGLFHMHRTGEGVFVESSLLRSACTGQVATWQIIQHDPVKLAVIQTPVETKLLRNSIVTTNAFCTKDGVWVQLLGVDIDRHLPLFLSAFKVKYSTYLNVLKVVVTEVLPSKQKSLVLKLMPVFITLNTILRDCFAKLNWDECQSLLEKHELWYCVVNTIPLVRYSKQAQELGIFEVDPKTNLTDVKSPIEFK
jgi:crotonobetainyl-CoA:carnitine CoA-transferase CaiB-like acyl-CoA transferase